MKKLLALALTGARALTLLAGCGGSGSDVVRKLRAAVFGTV